MMLYVAYFVMAFTIVQLLVATSNLVFEKYLPESDESVKDLISVLIPARNEENNIRNILDDLMNQVYRNIEIIVFNDQSQDRTAEIVTEYTIRDKRIKLINSCGLPKGWLGKNFACHSLSGFAKGKYFLFIDADVRIDKNVVGRAVSYSVRNDIDLISVFPKQIMKTFGEKITVPNMNYILVSLLPLVLVRKFKFPSLAAANGQFMFFNAKKYNWAKPHEKVRDIKVEDIMISRMYKKFGLHTGCLLGDDSITCRMYTGFNAAVQGFSKNVIAFFGNSFILAILFWLMTTAGFIPVLSQFKFVFFIEYIILYVSTRIIISVASRQNIIDNLLYILPLQFSLFAFISKASLNKIFKKLEWKGRNID